MKKALLVGINNYEKSPLSGCINDCKDVGGILEGKFDFETKYLFDKEATRKNILDNLKAICNNLQPQDSFVFHFSGHGSQVSASGDHKEIDNLDEVICTYDTYITDNELNNIFVDKKFKSLVILDCCHSGTGLRNVINKSVEDIINIKPRYMKREYIKYRFNLIDWFKNLWNRIFSHDTHSSVTFNLNTDTIDQGNAILITACLDSQVAADAYISGRYNGAMTRMLCTALQKSDYNITYLELVSNTNKLLKQYGFSQTPQLECKTEFFTNIFLQ